MFNKLFKRVGFSSKKESNLTDEGRQLSAMVRQQNAMMKQKQQELKMMSAWRQMRMLDDQLDREREEYDDLFEDGDQEDGDVIQEPNLDLEQMFTKMLMQKMQGAHTTNTPDLSQLTKLKGIADKVDWEKLLKLAEKHKLLKE